MTQPKTRRDRGRILTDKGWRKIWDAIKEKFPDGYTFQGISEITDPYLHPESVNSVSVDTVVNLLKREKPADKGKIESLFRAFGLKLDVNDHDSFKSYTLKSNSDVTEGKKHQTFVLPEKIPPVRNWVGRSREIDTLKSQILDPETRAITITAVCLVGLAGIGKTTLASKLIRELQTENAPFTVAAWETLRSPTGKAPRFDSMIDSLLFDLSNGEITPAFTILDDYRQKTDRLVKCLKEKPCLLVLDNVETVLQTGKAKRAGYFADECAEYAWLFQQIAETEHQSKVMFTSREILAALSGKETKTLPLGGLDHESAVTLLKAFDLIATPEELAELAKRYDGHPKALEIVGALIVNEPEYQGSVGKFLQDVNWLLVNSLDELIDQVIQRLSDEELICLSQISVYETPEYPLSVNAIAAQMSEMSKRDVKENIIEALKRRQLLDYNRNYDSYQMHPLVEEKASHLLNPELAIIAHRKAYRHFLDIVKPEAEWKELNDVKPLLRAHYHACCAEDWDEAVGAISGCYDFLRLAFYFQLLQDLYSKLIPRDWREGKQLVTSPEVHTDILRHLGVAYFYLCQYKAAIEYLSVSLSTASQIRYCEGEAAGLCEIGKLYLKTGDYQISLDYLKQSLIISGEIAARKIECKALISQGYKQHYLGDTYLAIEIFKEALDIARQIKSPELEGHCLIDLGFLYNYLGDYTSAIYYMNEYRSIPDCYKGMSFQKSEQVYLANIYFNKGETEKAQRFARESLRLEKDMGEKCGIDSFISFGISHRFFEDLEESIEYFEKRFNRAKEIGAKFDEAWALYQIGMSYRKLGQHDSSLEHFHKSLSIFQEIGSRAYEAKTLLALAKTSLLINTVGKRHCRIPTIQYYLDRAEKISLELKLPLLTEVEKMKSELATKETAFFH